MDGRSLALVEVKSAVLSEARRRRSRRFLLWLRVSKFLRSNWMEGVKAIAVGLLSRKAKVHSMDETATATLMVAEEWVNFYREDIVFSLTIFPYV